MWTSRATWPSRSRSSKRRLRQAPRIVLASQSPRRRDLLTLIGITHTIRPADIDERVLPGEPPIACAERLARGKAAVIAAAEPDALVIGADTIVVIDDRILNKPADAAEALSMLRRLRGRMHQVHTAVCVMWGDTVVSGVETARVRFRALTDAELLAYIATGEPMDKAGAYGIQGFGATIVDRIEGDFFAVMGLPLVRLIGLMREAGVSYEFGVVGVM